MHATPTASAQQKDENSLRQVYTQAYSDYSIGRIEQALEQLTSHEANFAGNLQQNAYRLIALCHLALDHGDMARNYAKLLLDVNPYYTPLDDPQRFVEMLNELKNRQTKTVTTASSRVESVTETPVPMTIITREMIDQLGNNKSLNSILAAYVPGLTEVSAGTMDNLAMRGVYTSGQEKLLIMENGHRLNARSTNNGKLDYAVSTEKIDHIEVLRGPASSLYGNVALTGVVNIILKSGRSINGVKAKYGYGSHNTHRLDIVAGTSFLKADLMAWTSYYGSSGQLINIPAATGPAYPTHNAYAYAGRYSGKPSYDWGTRMTIGDFTIMFSNRLGKQVPQYTLYGEAYDYDRYRKFNGYTPGLSVNETHYSLNYSKDFGKFSIDATIYGDEMEFQDYQSVSDSIVNVTFNIDGSVVTDEQGKPVTKLYNGLSQAVNWEEFTLGAQVMGSMTYRLGSMKGDLLLGTQFEHFNLNDTYSLIGEEYDMVSLVLPASKNYIKTGNENLLSVFLQDKHFITPWLIVNAGLRYDHKFRVNNRHVSALSPRLALIYQLKETLSAKLSYARSFVDAPYFYRQNSSNSYRGSEDLMPEHMDALQLDFYFRPPNLPMYFDLNFYYNQLTDIINNTQNTEITSVKFRNSGSLKTIGAEFDAAYSLPVFRVRFTASCQWALSASDYYYQQNHIFSVPLAEAKLQAAVRLFGRGNHNLWLTTALVAATKTLEKGSPRIADSQPYYQHGRVLADMGLRYQPTKIIQLAIDVDNLLNTTYYVGGTTYFPYQRPGRTAMATLSLKF